MLLPQSKLRKLYLERALRGYPLYNPPHKVEERLLSRKLADENFDYFIRVRQERAAFFQSWLHRYFWVALTPNEKGVRALNCWGNKYAGLLLYREGPGVGPSRSFFSYDPPWEGDYAGCNALFDMGTAYGEILIACCPKLHWAVEPAAATLPRSAARNKPKLTGWDDPTWQASPHHEVFGFAHQMFANMITFRGNAKYRESHPAERRLIRQGLLSKFKRTLQEYPSGDPYQLRGKMSAEEYAQWEDSDEEEDRDDE
jgi:hypothetical protein